jgi:CheY-like chemotaxis protein
MPHLSGLGLVRQARAKGYMGKFIVFAGSPQGEDREAYEKLRVDRIVDKPAANDELVSAVADIAANIGTP